MAQTEWWNLAVDAHRAHLSTMPHLNRVVQFLLLSGTPTGKSAKTIQMAKAGALKLLLPSACQIVVIMQLATMQLPVHAASGGIRSGIQVVYKTVWSGQQR